MEKNRMALGYPEEEVGFRVANPKQFSQLLEKLWPSGGLINLDGKTLALVSEEIRGSLHMFSARTNGKMRERLRVSSDSRGLKTRFERKRSVNNTKYEKLVQKTKKKHKTVQLFKQIQPVIAVFYKERATLVYKFMAIVHGKSVQRYVRIGIDRIAAIPAHLSDTGSGFAFYDVDIEGDGYGSERLFAGSKFFRDHLRKYLRPITPATSKWRVARKASSNGGIRKQKYKSYEDVLNFMEYSSTEFKRIFPDGYLLAGPTSFLGKEEKT